MAKSPLLTMSGLQGSWWAQRSKATATALRSAPSSPSLVLGRGKGEQGPRRAEGTGLRGRNEAIESQATALWGSAARPWKPRPHDVTDQRVWREAERCARARGPAWAETERAGAVGGAGRGHCTYGGRFELWCFPRLP